MARRTEIVKYYGNKSIRIREAGDETLYYTVYSLDDNTLCYIYFQKEGEDFILTDCYSADVRDDVVMTDRVLPADLPSAILGDKLPADCYLENYTSEEIAEKIEFKWSNYYHTCNQINLPHSLYHDKDGVAASKFIRCIHSVSVDLMRDENSYHGMYVYDLYVHEDGTGVLYFYHLYYADYLKQSAYHIIQEETISLTVEEVSKNDRIISHKVFGGSQTLLAKRV